LLMTASPEMTRHAKQRGVILRSVKCEKNVRKSEVMLRDFSST
jgi:hypothetical protein